jgi:hypothetical protein
MANNFLAPLPGTKTRRGTGGAILLEPPSLAASLTSCFAGPGATHAERRPSKIKRDRSASLKVQIRMNPAIIRQSSGLLVVVVRSISGSKADKNRSKQLQLARQKDYKYIFVPLQAGKMA